MSNGDDPMFADDGVTPPRYISFLPAAYRTDDFTSRFLKIFEDVLAPIERLIDVLPLYFDPMLTDSAFLPWLGSWVDVSEDDRIPLERRRMLIGKALELHRWRGTKKGLEDLIEVAVGVRPIIEDGRSVHIVGDPSSTSREGQEEGTSEGVIVTLRADGLEQVRDLIEILIEAHKPAHLTYELRLEPRAREKAVD